MKNGTVKFFNEAKGFGFIKEEGGQDIFVHATGLQEDIRENDNVVFEIQEGKKGLKRGKREISLIFFDFITKPFMQMRGFFYCLFRSERHELH